MRKIAILFGGKSNENEISVLTGVFVLNLIDREKYLPVPVYIHTDGQMYTSPRMSDLGVFRKGDFSSFKRIFFDGGGHVCVQSRKDEGEVSREDRRGAQLLPRRVGAKGAGSPR